MVSQKNQSIENIRLKSSSIFNDLQNLLNIYDKERDEYMYKKTAVVITTLNNYILYICSQIVEEGK